MTLSQKISNWYFQFVLVLGWVSGGFPVPSPWSTSWSYRLRSIPSIYSWSLCVAVSIVTWAGTTLQTTLRHHDAVESHRISEYLMYHGIFIFYYIPDMVRRLYALRNCEKIIAFLKVNNPVKIPIGIIFLLGVHFTCVLVRTISFFVFYLSDKLQLFFDCLRTEGISVKVLTTIFVIICVYPMICLLTLYSIGFLTIGGLKVAAAYSKLCCNFKHLGDRSRCGLRLSMIEILGIIQDFGKLKTLFNQFQTVGGGFALTLIVGNTFFLVLQVFAVFCQLTWEKVTGHGNGLLEPTCVLVLISYITIKINSEIQAGQGLIQNTIKRYANEVDFRLELVADAILDWKWNFMAGADYFEIKNKFPLTVLQILLGYIILTLEIRLTEDAL